MLFESSSWLAREVPVPDGMVYIVHPMYELALDYSRGLVHEPALDDVDDILAFSSSSSDLECRLACL